MRLKHIKLAGFKSFVDPTKVPFEKQMTAIVGPNGCGKSNIIDAVRWVLGESSAKNLRGDAMTDVIFNGASTRKPVGQASVELLFDNMAGRIDGSMADRNQVSIRRVVNRDSQNTYFLNGSKCRRKDITDIFLGTGLGPRSYAIIEQGTISRLIESKPQELRVFIEEAAGISKYKERRRDTENRIRHTRENLERLTDIRIELDNQLEKLHQQAEAAKRFRTLKKQERKFKAELALLRWKKFDKQLKHKQEQMALLQQQVEQSVITQNSEEITLFTAKQSLQSSNETIQNLQQQKILLTNDIARVEQHIKHVKQQQQKLQLDKDNNIEQLANAQTSLLSEQAQLGIIVAKLEHHQPNFEQLNTELLQLRNCLDNDNTRLSELQRSWHTANQQKEQNAQQHLEIIREKSELTAKLDQSNMRLEKLKEHLSELTKQKQQVIENEKNTRTSESLTLSTEQFDQLRHDYQALIEELEKAHSAVANLDSQRASCKATLEISEKQIALLVSKLAIKSDWQQAQSKWLGESNIEHLQTLQQKLAVSSGWEKAVEIVLSHQLQAQLVSKLPFDKLTSGTIPELINLLVSENTPAEIKSDSLAKHVSGAPEVTSLFNQIKVASDYQDALSMLPNLTENESVICKEGTWLSRRFIIHGAPNNNDVHLSFQRELNEHQQKKDLLLKDEKNIEVQSLQMSELIQILNGKKVDISGQLKSKELQIAQLKEQHYFDQKSLQLIDQQLATLTDEEELLLIQVKTFKAALSKIQSVAIIQSAEEGVALESQVNEELKGLQQQVQYTQQRYNELVQQKHNAELNTEKYKHQQQQHQNNIARFQESISQLTKQQANNCKLIEENHQPLVHDEQQLQTWLAQMANKDEQLQHAQVEIVRQQSIIDQVEQNQRKAVETTNQIKEQLNQLNLDSESCRLRSESALEQLVELRQTVQSVQENIPDNARESQWQAQLIKLGKDIQVLGAINLAAIDEFEAQLTRKNYLDQQDQDLNLAITTLESAIAKIDKESRQKFKTTFDKVNEDLQSLFPKVFGGGSAYLTLTGEDLLDTGITIMARPPGKKNSTIHLLSGGEKALTALSLVFAIFRLNPAPFCMLDEVDAPLDDANVSRFCNLVEEMSQTVQFIYISHNKIAMEMAAHLTGVTMFEAGVSRMVAVDIDEAVAMAEVS